jgi:ATP-binding cassette subfamily F protein uup
MLIQRGTPATVAEPAKAKRATALAPTTNNITPKLSFKEQHELKTLTAEIARLQSEVKKAEAILAQPGLYNKDIKKFKAATNALSDAQAALTVAEERWLELEVLREAS